MRLPDWYRERQRCVHKSRRDATIYETLKRGPIFSELIEDALPRDALVSKVGKLIAPAKESYGYPLVIGEYGTGKTSLIQLAVDSLKEPKGIVYVKIPDTDDVNTDPTIVIDTVRDALGWTLDPVIDSGNRRWSGSFESVRLKLMDQQHQIYTKYLVSSPVSLESTGRNTKLFQSS